MCKFHFIYKKQTHKKILTGPGPKGLLLPAQRRNQTSEADPRKVLGAFSPSNDWAREDSEVIARVQGKQGPDKSGPTDVNSRTWNLKDKPLPESRCFVDFKAQGTKKQLTHLRQTSDVFLFFKSVATQGD